VYNTLTNCRLLIKSVSAHLCILSPTTKALTNVILHWITHFSRSTRLRPSQGQMLEASISHSGFEATGCNEEQATNNL